MSNENNELRDKILEHTREINEQEAEFNEVQLLCQDLVLDFKDANFHTNVATQMQYDEHTMFTEGNVTNYLAELEEYFSSLITYTAHKKGDPNASVSSVPLGSLINKDWLAREMNIDPAFDITVHTQNDQEEEEATPDVNLLYERFQEKVERNLI